MPDPTDRRPRLTLSALAKGIRVACQLSAFVASSEIGSVLIRDAKKARSFRLRQTSRYSQRVLRSLGVTVTVEGTPTDSSTLIVSNHLSYLDVLAFSSIRPAIFVTSVEVRETAVLGTLCKAGGSLFVERRKFAALKEEVSAISQLLSDGFSVVLFPEGTSSCGEVLLPFRKSLLDAAVTAQSSVQPVCLNYRAANANPLDATSRDSIFYYGDMDFFSHLRRLLALKSVDLTVRWLTPIASSRTLGRKDLADSAYDQIAAAYQPVALSPLI